VCENCAPAPSHPSKIDPAPCNTALASALTAENSCSAAQTVVRFAHAYTMTFDFETPHVRLGTDSQKWQKYASRDILPLWVADMDFK